MCQDAPSSGSGSPESVPTLTAAAGLQTRGPRYPREHLPHLLSPSLPGSRSPSSLPPGVPAQCERLPSSFSSTPLPVQARSVLGWILIISIQEPKYFLVTFTLQLYFESPELLICPSVRLSHVFAFIKRTWWMNLYLSPLFHNCAFLELKYFVALQNIVCFEQEHGPFLSFFGAGEPRNRK